MSHITIVMFVAILLISLGITAWAARRTRTTVDFYAAGRGLTAAQNGFALAGDWCSAAAFLGFTGLTALYGMDGALYAVGPLVAFCTVLLLIAEPLRNTGTYTIGDVSCIGCGSRLRSLQRSLEPLSSILPTSSRKWPEPGF
jgi:cation/acetate symporter